MGIKLSRALTLTRPPTRLASINSLTPLEPPSRRYSPSTPNISPTMAGDKLPSIHTLDKPEDYRTLLKEEVDDCFPCKLVGEAPFLISYRFHSQRPLTQGRRRCFPWSRDIHLLLGALSA